MQITWRRTGEFGGEFPQHPDKVTGFELRRGDQSDSAGIVQGVFELGQAVRRVDVDQDQPGLRRGKLDDYPFGIVRRPHADAVGAFEPERQKAGGEGADPFFQLTVGPTDLLASDDQRITLGKPLEDPVEIDTDRIADKRRNAPPWT